MVYKYGKLTLVLILSYITVCNGYISLYAHEERYAHMIAQKIAMIGSVALVGTSVTYGIYNLGIDNALLKSIEIRYNLVPEYDWYQLPQHYFVEFCSLSHDSLHLLTVDPVVKAVYRKIAHKNDLELFDFAHFTHHVPHIDVHGLYGIATSYFKDFNAQSLGDLKRMIDNSLLMIEQDYNKLKKLTHLSNKVALPVTFEQYTKFMDLLSNNTVLPVTLEQYIKCMDPLSKVTYRFVCNLLQSLCGYSILYNSQRVHDCLVTLVRYYAYIQMLHDLCSACIDDDQADMQAGGMLHFALQHVQYRQSIEIR